jgi:Ca-activated chloride channel family protein
MSFKEPVWLAAAASIPLLLVGIWWLYDARQKAALDRFVSAALRGQLLRSVSRAKRVLQRASLCGAFALLCVALAGPLVGFRWQEIDSRGNEIVFAIDTSRSMLAPDVKPNRLTRAKLGVDDLSMRLANDALGIVAFAGSAFLVNPITLDHVAFRGSLNALDTRTIPRGGTNIASAIQVATLALQRHAGTKILILLTDGEDLEGDAVAAARAAHQAGLVIYTVGVGTAAGELIPLPPEEGGYVKDEAGAVVRSRLDEPKLESIAAAAGGFYVPLGARNEGLDRIYERAIGNLAKHELRSRQEKIYIDRYQWPLASSLALLLASLLIGTRRRSALRAPAVPARTEGRAIVALVVAATLLSLAVAPLSPMRAADVPATSGASGAVASSPTVKGKPLVEFDSGTKAYRAGQFPAAAQAFQQSITQAPSSAAQRLAQQEDAYYNLGNTLYRAGQATEKSAPEQTLKQWNDAVRAYETALQLRPGDADSKFNRDFVKRKIAELEQPPKNNSGSASKPPPPKSGGGGGTGGTPPPASSPSQPPPSGSPPPGSSPTGSPPSGAPPSGASPPPPGRAGGAGAAPAPAQGPAPMTPEEARELLDSAKGDEHPAMGAPLVPSGANQPPPQPYKNW